MALAPPRPCPQPHCARLLAPGQACPDHPRPSAAARGYTAAWTVYAATWLRRFPWCGMRQDGVFYSEHSHCVRRGARVPAQVVDHIRSIASGGAVFDPTNHQSLCRSCNVRKG